MTMVTESAAQPADAAEAGGVVRRPMRWPWILVLVVAVAGAGALALAWRGDDDPVADALAVVREDASFATATEAGAAYTRISVVLQKGAESCAESDGRHCDHLFSASAHARVSAVSLLSCTRRDVLEARAAMTGFLERLQDDAGAALPPVPRCA